VPLVALLLVSWCLPVQAQQFKKECDPNDSELCSQPLVKGEAAPFSGQLLTPKLAITLAQKADSFDTRLAIELKYTEKMYRLDTDLQKKLHDLDQKACTEKVDLLTSRLKTAQQAHWYQKPAFIVIITVILTSGVFVGGAYVFNAAQNGV